MENGRFDLRYWLAAADFRAMMNAHWRLSRFRMWRVRGLRAFVLIGACVAGYGWWTTSEPVDAVVAILLGSSPLLAPVINRWHYDRAFRRQRLGEAEARLIVDEAGVQFRSALGEARYPWTSVRRVEKSAGRILLWIHPYQALIAPPGAFRDAAQQQLFLAMATEKTEGQSL
jgi:hypothetical protein